MPASRTAVRPARQRFILDGREPDGMLAIPRDHAVHRCNLRIVDAVERRGACRSSVVGHTSFRRFVDRTLRGFCRGGIQALWAVGTLDKGRASRRKRRQIASAIAEGRHRADANHAKDLDRTYALAMVSALIPTIRVTAYWPELPTFTSSMIVTVAGLSRRLQCRAPGVTNVILRRAVRCRIGRRHMSRRSQR